MTGTLKVQRGPWKIDPSFDHSELHVRPRGDVVWHPLSVDCPCRPTQDSTEVRDEDGDRMTVPVFLHVAMDGREERPPEMS